MFQYDNTFTILSLIPFTITLLLFIISYQASWDEPAATIVMHRCEPTRLQHLSLRLADKVSNLVDNNERLIDSRMGDQRFKDRGGFSKDGNRRDGGYKEGGRRDGGYREGREGRYGRDGQGGNRYRDGGGGGKGRYNREGQGRDNYSRDGQRRGDRGRYREGQGRGT